MPPRKGKGKPGRPPRGHEVERLAVYLRPALKRWLQHRAVGEGRDMGQIVTDALEAYRARVKS